MPIYRLNTKLRVTILCLSDFELYSRWVPLTAVSSEVFDLFDHCKMYKLLTINFEFYAEA